MTQDRTTATEDGNTWESIWDGIVNFMGRTTAITVSENDAFDGQTKVTVRQTIVDADGAVVQERFTEFDTAADLDALLTAVKMAISERKAAERRRRLRALKQRRLARWNRDADRQK